MTLLQYLKEEIQEEHKDTMRCIVFVRTRDSARKLSEMFLSIVSTSADMSWLKPDYVVGKKDMTSKTTKDKLGMFRSGETNVLFSTPVTEVVLEVLHLSSHATCRRESMSQPVIWSSNSMISAMPKPVCSAKAVHGRMNRSTCC